MLDQLLAGYAAPEGRFDELLAAPGRPRPHWDAFVRALAERSEREVSDTLSLTERQIREHGITYNVYADAQGVHRPWEVDPIPLVLPADEWAGDRRRHRAARRPAQPRPRRSLRRADAAEERRDPAAGDLRPPRLPRARRRAAARPGGRHLLQYAADLARSPDGRWWVVSDRTQAPSGSGYALENRLVVSRVFPQMFRELPVQHLASFFDALRSSLLHWAPRGDGPTRIVLLTPGPYNETYFEHALLARYLGFALVEGSDLTVRDDRVWLKTIDGLQRVHAIVRRQDDDYCDPLELRSDSALGVAGLTDCARRGNVLLANALGSGVLESGALLGYLPRLSRELLGEPLQLPSIATWWLGEPAAFEDAWRRPERLIIKPIERSPNEPGVVVENLSAEAREALRLRIAQRPQHFVAQEWVHVSQAPVLEGTTLGALAARTVGLRVFAVATPSGWRVMPGGLTRVAGDEDSPVIAMQRGGRSKDTWVLADGPVNAEFSLLSTTVTADDLVGADATLASRAAENLFWFGRYGERCDATARLLRVAIGQVLDDGGTHVGPPPAWTLAERLGIVEPSKSAARALRRAATHAEGALSAAPRQPVARRLQPARPDVGRPLAHPQPPDRRPGAAARAGAADDAGLARPRDHGDDDALRLRPRRHDARHRLALRLDGPARRAAGDDVQHAAGGDRRGPHARARLAARARRFERHLPLALPRRAGMAAGARHGGARRGQPALARLPGQGPRRFHRQARGDARRLRVGDAGAGARGAARARARRPAPESEALADVIEQLQRAAYAVSDATSLKFFSHAVPRSMLPLAA